MGLGFPFGKRMNLGHDRTNPRSPIFRLAHQSHPCRSPRTVAPGSGSRLNQETGVSWSGEIRWAWHSHGGGEFILLDSLVHHVP